MIEQLTYKKEHMLELKESDATSWLGAFMGDKEAEALEASVSYTVVADGRIIGCYGGVIYWSDRMEVWAALSDDIAKHFVGVHRLAARALDTVPCRRLEAKVDAGYMNAHRWVNMLGFKLETALMKNYFPDGRDACGYVRIK